MASSQSATHVVGSDVFPNDQSRCGRLTAEPDQCGSPSSAALILTDRDHEDLVVMAEPRVTDDTTDPTTVRYGTMFGGLSTFTEAWSEHTWCLAIEPAQGCHDLPPKMTSQWDQPISTEEGEYPEIDLLVVEPPRRTAQDERHLSDRWMDCLGPSGCHKVEPPTILLVQDPESVMYRRSQPHAAVVKKMAALGYRAREFLLDALDCGAAVDQRRWVTLFLQEGGEVVMPKLDVLPLRPCENLITPAGLVPRHLWKRRVGSGPPARPYPSGERGARVVEDIYLPDRGRVYCTDGPMPIDSHAYVRDPKYGARRIVRDEFAKALGVSDAADIGDRWIPGLTDTLRCTTSLHIWSVLDSVIRPTLLHRGRMSAPLSGTVDHAVADPGIAEEEDADWDWQPPDMHETGPWFQARVANLRRAAAKRGNRQRVFRKGMATLRRYVRTMEGKETTLNLLWWEWPESHQERLRKGCDQLFQVCPEEGIVPNQDMDPDQLETAAEFVDELIEMGVLIECRVPMKRNGPLLVIPKEGQPGQWRVLSDMKRGGQNAYMAKDPVAMPRVADIAASLCHGGYSAIIDISKEFYHFPTREEDQPYLGLIHPKTGKHYCYAGSPMGSASTPGISGQATAVVKRLIMEHEHAQGTIVVNDVTNHLTGEPYHPRWPEGRIVVAPPDHPVPCLRNHPLPSLWIHVDDFFLHHATRDGCDWILSLAMDIIVNLGLLAHRKKVKRPAQLQRFCGFNYDTTGIPQILVPQEKNDRGIASIQYLERKKGSSISRLTVAVVTGFLQSLVPATTGNIGAALLRYLYDVIHEDDGSGLLPSTVHYYYRWANLTDEAWAAMSRWKRMLQEGACRVVRPVDPAVLVSFAGDGSGTGTGCTVQFDSSEVRTPSCLEAWMGAWQSRALEFSSNWKELYTILGILRRERGQGRVEGRHAFYVTDSTTVYHGIQRGSSGSPRLHQLIVEIKMICASMQVELEAVHIPGLAIIRQGSDPLSRGLWLPPDPRRLAPSQEIARLFEPAPATPSLQLWAVSVRNAIASPGPPPTYSLVRFDQPWRASDLKDRATIWFPPPRQAGQAMAAMVDAWVESPLDTEALFVVPRICTRMWRRAHKAFRDIARLKSGETWRDQVIWDQNELPLILMYLPPHQRSLPSPSDMDSPSSHPTGARHRAQAAAVRGL